MTPGTRTVPQPPRVRTPLQTGLLTVTLVLGALAGFIIFAIGGSVLSLAVLRNFLPADLALDGSAFCGVVGELLGTALFVRYVARQPLASLGLVRYAAGRRWLSGALVGFFLISLVVVVWLTAIVGSRWSVNLGQGAAIGLAGSAIFFLVQGPAEELLFRGAILTFVTRRWGPWWGIGVSSVLFGLLHAANPSFAVLPLVNLALFGAAMACYVLFVDAGQLWGVFAIHSVWNWFEEFIYGLPNSGALPPTGNTLFIVSPDTSGPAWLWGGGFGPEGTLGTTLVLLAMIALCLRGRSRRTRQAAVAPQ